MRDEDNPYRSPQYVGGEAGESLWFRLLILVSGSLSWLWLAWLCLWAFDSYGWLMLPLALFCWLAHLMQTAALVQEMEQEFF